MDVVWLLLRALLVSAVGFGVLAGAVRWLNRHWPFDIHREIVEEKNTAVALVVGALLLGLSIIFAAAVIPGP